MDPLASSPDSGMIAGLYFIDDAKVATAPSGRILPGCVRVKQELGDQRSLRAVRTIYDKEVGF